MDALRRAAELAEEHLAGLDDRPVAATTGYEDVVTALDEPLPDRGEDPVAVLERLAAVAGPATVASPGPRYFGFVTGGALPAALGADWLASAWDQNSFSRVSSPASAAIESVAERWVLEALGLPAGAAVGFTTGATMGNFTCLAAARNAVLARVGWDVEADGLTGAPPVRVVVGEHAHASLLLALRYVGLGRPADVVPAERGAMRADALAIGDGPTIVCAQAGEVNTGASDPLAAIADACEERGAWLHVDGAFGLWAAASPALRGLVHGHDRAQSWAVDAHKWLNVPYDGGLAIVADRDALRAAMGVTAGYLPGSGGREPLETVPEMSRRGRAIPVYAALRQLGRDGLAALVERNCALARRAATALTAAGAEVVNDVVLNQVLVRFGDDDTTRATIERVQRGGEAWLGGTVWEGRAAARISVSNWATTEADVDRLVAALTS